MGNEFVPRRGFGGLAKVDTEGIKTHPTLADQVQEHDPRTPAKFGLSNLSSSRKQSQGADPASRRLKGCVFQLNLRYPVGKQLSTANSPSCVTTLVVCTY